MHLKYTFRALWSSISQSTSHYYCRWNTLERKMQGFLLVETSMDDNNQLLRISYAIVDEETDRSWKQLMMNLKVVIGEHPNLVFVFDRHSIITNEVDAVFPTSFHALCTYHLEKNVLRNFKDKTTTSQHSDCQRGYSDCHILINIGTNFVAFRVVLLQRI